MTASTPASNLGRHVFGVAAFAFGLVTLAWRTYNDWHLQPYFAYSAAAVLIFGGAAIQFRRTAKSGAFALATAYLVFALRCVPQIVTAPQIYNSWGNFFEQFSLVTGAAMVYAGLSSTWSSAGSPQTLSRMSRILFGICVASFALEQAFYLAPTVSLVPKWLPPNPVFWAVATTVFFALAALALIADRIALLAARLLTIMLVSFGLLVWMPLVLSDLHNLGNWSATPKNFSIWSETAETFAIAGAAWILADLLGEYKLNH